MSAPRDDADLLRRCAGKFDELAGQADRVVETLRGAVEALGGCGCQDEIGRGFADEHVEEAGKAPHDLEELPARMRATGAGFAERAAAQQRAGEAGAEEFGRNTGQG